MKYYYHLVATAIAEEAKVVTQKQQWQAYMISGKSFPSDSQALAVKAKGFQAEASSALARHDWKVAKEQAEKSHRIYAKLLENRKFQLTFKVDSHRSGWDKETYGWEFPVSYRLKPLGASETQYKDFKSGDLLPQGKYEVEVRQPLMKRKALVVVLQDNTEESVSLYRDFTKESLLRKTRRELVNSLECESDSYGGIYDDHSDWFEEEMDVCHENVKFKECTLTFTLDIDGYKRRRIWRDGERYSRKRTYDFEGRHSVTKRFSRNRTLAYEWDMGDIDITGVMLGQIGGGADSRERHSLYFGGSYTAKRAIERIKKIRELCSEG